MEFTVQFRLCNANILIMIDYQNELKMQSLISQNGEIRWPAIKQI